MHILFCINSIGRVGGIEMITLVKANFLAETFKKNNNGEVAICFSDKCDFPKTMIPLSPDVKIYDTQMNFYGNTMRNLPKFIFRFIKKLYLHRKRIQSVINEFKPDVIISVGQAEKFVFPFLHSYDKEKKLIKIREVHFNSNYRFFRYKKWLASFTNFIDFNIFSQAFDRVYLLTQQDKRENFADNKRYAVMPNPVSFNLKEGNEEFPRSKTVLAVGRLVPQKNFASLLRIWAMVKNKHKDWKLRIVGDGSEMFTLQQLAKDLKISDSVEFTGYSNKVREEMLKASIIAFTSLYEGFALVLLEAASCGLAAISYKTPYGPEDIIKDGKTGILVDYLNESEFADKLDALMSNDQLQQQMGLEAQKVVAEYSTEAIMNRWIKEYASLLGVSDRLSDVCKMWGVNDVLFSRFILLLRGYKRESYILVSAY